MVNIIFLDIDGVLNGNGHGHSTAEKYEFFDAYVENLKTLINSAYDVKLVISSSWRHFKINPSISNDKSWRDELESRLGIEGVIIDDVPTLPSNSRADEIEAWLNENKGKLKVGSFVILDDECTAIHKKFPNNVVDCKDDNGFGFTTKKLNEATWILTSYGKNAKHASDNLWFISDTHFGHANIIKYCNRPWNHGKDTNGEIIATDEDVLAMDNEIIKRWNSVVGKNDIVWHLGDFAFGGKAVAERVFPQLNGKINLVIGNHDHWKLKWYYDLGFNRVYDRQVIVNDFVILSHAPLMFLNANTPFYNIFGHIHDSTVYQTWTKTSACVCVERHDYYPVSWKTIKEKYEEMNGK